MAAATSLVGGIGLVAASLSAVTFVPQVWRTWQTRSARDLSAPMLGVAASSMVLWLVYGYYERNVPVLFGNAVNLFFTLLLVYFKWRFRGRESGRPNRA